MSRRRQIARGVVGRHVNTNGLISFGSEEKKTIKWSQQQDPNSFDTPEVGEKKAKPFVCQYCGRDNFKMAAHKAKHEKSCKQKE